MNEVSVIICETHALIFSDTLTVGRKFPVKGENLTVVHLSTFNQHLATQAPCLVRLAGSVLE